MEKKGEEIRQSQNTDSEDDLSTETKTLNKQSSNISIYNNVKLYHKNKLVKAMQENRN